MIPSTVLFREVNGSYMYKQARILDYFEKKKSVLLDHSSKRSLEESCLQVDHDVSV